MTRFKNDINDQNYVPTQSLMGIFTLTVKDILTEDV